MALSFPPRLGAVVQCDFFGMIAPEMVKKRDVVVIARNKRNNQLVTVIPLSTTEPVELESHHHALESNPRPDGDKALKVWAKCDMIYTVSLARLDMYYTHSRRGGRQSVTRQVSRVDLLAIRMAVASALNLSDNSSVPARDLESVSASALKQPD